MIIFFICASVVIIQRLVELVIAKNHTRKMLDKGAIEYDSGGYIIIVIMHICFFASLIFEFVYYGKYLNQLWYLFIFIFLLAQILRYWSIKSLGIFWNTRIIVLKGAELVKSGPYKFLRHPNYIAVTAELASLPLIFSCYITAVIFTILNLFILKRRIRIETNALMQN